MNHNVMATRYVIKQPAMLFENFLSCLPVKSQTHTAFMMHVKFVSEKIREMESGAGLENEIFRNMSKQPVRPHRH